MLARAQSWQEPNSWQEWTSRSSYLTKEILRSAFGRLHKTLQDKLAVKVIETVMARFLNAERQQLVAGQRQRLVQCSDGITDRFVLLQPLNGHNTAIYERLCVMTHNMRSDRRRVRVRRACVAYPGAACTGYQVAACAARSS